MFIVYNKVCLPLQGNNLIKGRNKRLWLLKLLAIGAMLFIFQTPSYAVDITLEWDTNTEPDLAGYRVYFKVDSSGDRILDNYKGEGLVLLEESGTTRVVNSGFEISGVSCHLSGLDPAIIYFFVVTAFDTEGFESPPSREVSTDNIPPDKPTELTGVLGAREVFFEWSPSTDPVPGSGMAGYSYVLDAIPNTIPDPTPNLGLETSGTFYVPYDGGYYFHIRAVDKAGLDGPNASETVHYRPICIDTGPPVADYVFIDYMNNTLYVIYSETHLQNATLRINYGFDNGLLMSGDGTDVYGDGMVFSFPLNPATLDRYLIYTMTIAVNVTDCASNPIPVEQRTITINDDDHDGMADEWEISHGLNPMVNDAAADPDGDGLSNLQEYNAGTNPWKADTKGELVLDYGTLYGLWHYDQVRLWTRWNTADPDKLLAVDIDNDGTDELIASFAGYGLYTYEPTTMGWVRINATLPDNMKPIDFFQQ